MTLTVIKWKSDFNDFKVSFFISNSEDILTCGWNSKASPPHCTEGVGVYTPLLSVGWGEPPTAQPWFDGHSPLGQAFEILVRPQ